VVWQLGLQRFRKETQIDDLPHIGAKPLLVVRLNLNRVLVEFIYCFQYVAAADDAYQLAVFDDGKMAVAMTGKN